jgi:hypothetical protein
VLIQLFFFFYLDGLAPLARFPIRINLELTDSR